MQIGGCLTKCKISELRCYYRNSQYGWTVGRGLLPPLLVYMLIDFGGSKPPPYAIILKSPTTSKLSNQKTAEKLISAVNFIFIGIKV